VQLVDRMPHVMLVAGRVGAALRPACVADVLFAFRRFIKIGR
jgi:hypothetical protein